MRAQMCLMIKEKNKKTITVLNNRIITVHIVKHYQAELYIHIWTL